MGPGVKAAAVVLATAPVSVPGLYHYRETGRSDGMKLNDTFSAYVKGVGCGVFPPYAGLGCYMASVGAIDNLRRLGHNENLSRTDCYTQRDRAFRDGWIAGFSLYLTVPLAIGILRKIK